jgi:hypothetical protein
MGQINNSQQGSKKIEKHPPCLPCLDYSQLRPFKGGIFSPQTANRMPRTVL